MSDGTNNPIEPDSLWEDGYPTEAFLVWLTHATDHPRALELARAYFEQCRNFTVEQFETTFYGKKVQRVAMSTGGWSGCEDVIGALEENRMFWLCHWYSVRRGGHYVFDLECNFKQS